MTRYQPENGKIVGRNLPNYSNYFIYEGHTSFYIAAGDKPLLRIAQHKCLLGTLRLFSNGKPLDEMKHITSRFCSGMAEWDIEDEDFKGVVTVTAPDMYKFWLTFSARRISRFMCCLLDRAMLR